MDALESSKQMLSRQLPHEVLCIIFDCTSAPQLPMTNA
jgi:hypothetical protein